MYKLRIFGVANDSIVDGPGLRYSVFTQGCKHGCKGCHNPGSHDPDGGRLVNIEELLAEIEKNPLLDGVTFTGGEPLLQYEAVSELARQVKLRGLNTILYTGFLWDEALKFPGLLENIDILIDGRFENEKKSLDLKFVGSLNQRVIDVMESLRQNCVVTIDFNIM